jgi:hypothetical protein
MTLVAVWKAEGRLMAIADTRVARSVGNVLTEHGPKLLPITVVCRQPGVSGFFDKEVHRADIGFAYGGSTLSALAAHALANILCANLISNPGTPPPSLAEVAFAIAGISAEYIRDVGQLAGQSGQFKAIIFGHCPQQSKLRVFVTSPNISSGQLTVDIAEHLLDDIVIGGSANASTVVIGSAPDLLITAINADLAEAKARGEVHQIVAFDAPKRALQKLINEGANENVGGSVQQAQATQFGFKIIANMVPITPIPPSTRNAGLFVLGFDTFDLQNIGSHRVALEGR